MILNRQTTEHIEKSKKTLIIPFPAAMWGGEICPEQDNRLITTHFVWNLICAFHTKNNYPQIMCAGGLPNSKGITLAKSLAEYLANKNRHVQDYIILGEEQSTHTGQQIRFMEDQIRQEGYDLVFVVSNWWHLRGILRLFKNCHYSMPIIGIASPTYGSLPHRFSRAIQELIRYIMILTIDKKGTFFDYDTERRAQEALTK